MRAGKSYKEEQRLQHDEQGALYVRYRTSDAVKVITCLVEELRRSSVEIEELRIRVMGDDVYIRVGGAKPSIDEFAELVHEHLAGFFRRVVVIEVLGFYPSKCPWSC